MTKPDLSFKNSQSLNSHYFDKVLYINCITTTNNYKKTMSLSNLIQADGTISCTENKSYMPLFLRYLL